MSEQHPGMVFRKIEDQRQDVANKLLYWLHIGLQGVLGPEATDGAKWEAEAAEVLKVFQATIATHVSDLKAKAQ